MNSYRTSSGLSKLSRIMKMVLKINLHVYDQPQWSLLTTNMTTLSLNKQLTLLGRCHDMRPVCSPVSLYTKSSVGIRVIVAASFIFISDVRVILSPVNLYRYTEWVLSLNIQSTTMLPADVIPWSVTFILLTFSLHSKSEETTSFTKNKKHNQRYFSEESKANKKNSYSK